MEIKPDFEIKYQVSQSNEQAVPVIVVAAGNFMRMKGIHKQLTPICGVPVIIRTLLSFESSPFISRIILVLREGDIPEIQKLISNYGISKLSDIVCGGNSRGESVKNGFKRLALDEKKVLIHDGARPLVTSDIIKDAVIKLKSFDAVVAAVAVNDSLKRVDNSGFVSEAVDRSGIYTAQTPQGVDVEKYKKALECIDASAFTDDASIMQQAGYRVGISEGSPLNIKITTPQDIKLAELYLKDDEE